MTKPLPAELLYSVDDLIESAALSFELQTTLTTQIMEFTNETRTAIVVAAYRAARIAGVDTTTSMTIPVLQRMLQTEIDLFVEENPELFESRTDEEKEVFYDRDEERREQVAAYYSECGSVFSK